MEIAPESAESAPIPAGFGKRFSTYQESVKYACKSVTKPEITWCLLFKAGIKSQSRSKRLIVNA
ncbi:hypothetical protein ACVISU_005006 [Bradyrhizobium sp. USDA 4452]